jgi:hypothetical protein
MHDRHGKRITLFIRDSGFRRGVEVFVLLGCYAVCFGVLATFGGNLSVSS